MPPRAVLVPFFHSLCVTTITPLPAGASLFRQETTRGSHRTNLVDNTSREVCFFPFLYRGGYIFCSRYLDCLEIARFLHADCYVHLDHTERRSHWGQSSVRDHVGAQSRRVEVVLSIYFSPWNVNACGLVPNTHCSH